MLRTALVFFVLLGLFALPTHARSSPPPVIGKVSTVYRMTLQGKPFLAFPLRFRHTRRLTVCVKGLSPCSVFKIPAGKVGKKGGQMAVLFLLRSAKQRKRLAVGRTAVVSVTASGPGGSVGPRVFKRKIKAGT